MVLFGLEFLSRLWPLWKFYAMTHTQERFRSQFLWALAFISFANRIHRNSIFTWEHSGLIGVLIRSWIFTHSTDLELFTYLLSLDSPHWSWLGPDENIRSFEKIKNHWFLFSDEFLWKKKFVNVLVWLVYSVVLVCWFCEYCIQPWKYLTIFLLLTYRQLFLHELVHNS